MYGNVDYVPPAHFEDNTLKRSPSGCYQKSKVRIALCFAGLMLILTLCVLGIILPKYSYMKTEVEFLKGEQKKLASLGSFLVYSESHAKCAEVRSTSSLYQFELTASNCSPDSFSQFFRWLPRGRLMSTMVGLCVGAEKIRTNQPMRLFECNNERVINWVCTNETLLGVKGESLYFNFGNNRERIIMLYWGTGVWSRWKAQSLEGQVQDGGACVHCCA
ncbi:macrophage mannose receptor 1-like isoform X2 [Pyxicephalus adspersus]|uniref:macrophage mannose receptor 1-like isoform X2 n=1 Tax=Pyxicephalus adspersus TaxID=30357 RepID=UPI003B5C53EC